MSGEKSLWAAVITQAIMDATSPASTTRAEIDAGEARRWLTRPNEDFTIVCARAGLEPDVVRAFALKEIEAFERMQGTGQRVRRGCRRAFLSDRAA